MYHSNPPRLTLLSEVAATSTACVLSGGGGDSHTLSYLPPDTFAS